MPTNVSRSANVPLFVSRIRHARLRGWAQSRRPSRAVARPAALMIARVSGRGVVFRRVGDFAVWTLEHVSVVGGMGRPGRSAQYQRSSALRTIWVLRHKRYAFDCAKSREFAAVAPRDKRALGHPWRNSSERT